MHKADLEGVLSLTGDHWATLPHHHHHDLCLTHHLRDSIFHLQMATVACLRLTTTGSSGSAPPEDSASSLLASAATLLALEISIVFQTIAVFITW